MSTINKKHTIKYIIFSFHLIYGLYEDNLFSSWTCVLHISFRKKHHNTYENVLYFLKIFVHNTIINTSDRMQRLNWVNTESKRTESDTAEGMNSWQEIDYKYKHN